MYKKSNKFGNDLIAVYGKNPEAVQIIFQYNLVNFSIDIPDSNNNTILHHCVLQNDDKTLSLILNYILYDNTDYTTLINYQNNDGDTAMHIAVRNNYSNCARMLHKAGTNLSLSNNKGESIELDDNNTDNDNTYNNTKPLSDMIIDSISVISSDCDDDIFEKPNKGFNKIKSVVITPPITDYNDTQLFLNDLIKKLNPKLRGGKKPKRKNAKKKSKRSKAKSPSNIAHEQVIEKAKTELGMSEEDALAFKSGIYKLVKKQFPNLNNKERSFKMLELMKDKKIIKEIKGNLGEIKKVLAEHRKQKEEMKSKENH